MRELSTLVSTVAFWTAVGTAIFFIYKLAAGYLISNLSVELSQRRQSAKEDKDHLVIRIKLSKGERGTVALLDVRLRLIFADETIPLSVDDNLRFYVNDKDVMRPTIEFSRYDEQSHVLRLTPGEVTQFEAVAEVPATEIVRIEVAILGQIVLTNYMTSKRWLTRWFPKNRWVGQWRASVISLPGDKSKIPK